MLPGGMTHGSAASKLGGVMRSPETLRRSHAMPLMRTNEMMPAMTPYAMLAQGQYRRLSQKRKTVTHL